jgi:hypothetical protein
VAVVADLAYQLKVDTAEASKAILATAESIPAAAEPKLWGDRAVLDLPQVSVEELFKVDWVAECLLTTVAPTAAAAEAAAEADTSAAEAEVPSSYLTLEVRAVAVPVTLTRVL